MDDLRAEAPLLKAATDFVEAEFDLIHARVFGEPLPALRAAIQRYDQAWDAYVRLEPNSASLKWPRLFGQFFRFDEWSLCRG
jgi:hypothetical protein